MKKNTLLAFFIFLPLFIYSQQCPDPVLESHQYFCPGATNTLDDFDVTATGTLQWYVHSLPTRRSSDLDPIVNGVVYFVSQTNAPTCTESNLIPVVGYYSEMPRPDAKSNQYFCSSFNPTLDDFIVTATGTLTWYDDINQTTVLPGTTPLANNTTYYVSQQNALTCTESELTPVTAHLLNQHPTPIADSHQYFCAGATPTLDDFEVISPGNIEWTANPNHGVPLPGTTPIVDGTTYYVRTVGTGCQPSIRVSVTGHFTSMPDPIADSYQYFCSNSHQTLRDFAVDAIGTLT